MRQEAATTCLTPYVSEVKSLLDFGGDTGLMIPKMFDVCERYVLDVEPRQLENGVVCVDYSVDLKVDLVMCSHTMEHISDINKAMFEITKRLKPGGLLYIEVPDENPGAFDNNFLWYEHINLFNTPSLETLLTNHQFEILDSHTLGYPNPMTRSIAVIGRYSKNPIERQ
jgi:SAM-dependent methyltransferase